MTPLLLAPSGTPHFWPGREKGRGTAILLACPGRLEEAKGRPAANTSGGNLDLLLAALGRHLPDAFPSGDRYDYVISNSSTRVRYKSLTGDTVPCTEEIEEKANIARLLAEIGHCTMVLALGNEAGLAMDCATSEDYAPNDRFKGRILRGGHPSFSAINRRIAFDIDGRKIEKGAPEATARRMAVVARDILARANLAFG